MERPEIKCSQCEFSSCVSGCHAWLNYALELEAKLKAEQESVNELSLHAQELAQSLIEERLFIVQLEETIRDRVHAILEEGERETKTT